MDAHAVLLTEINDLANTRLRVGRDYCYLNDNHDRIEVELSKEDYDDVFTLGNIYTEKFTFVRDKTVEYKDGSLGLVYDITINESFRLDNDITEDNRPKYGVISPEGKFYECGYAGHNNLEFDLIQAGILKRTPVHGTTDAYEYYGWVKLTGAMMTDVEFLFSEKVTDYDFSKQEDILLVEHKITQAQVDQIIAYIKSLDREHVNYNYEYYHIDDFAQVVNFEGDRYDFERKYAIDNFKEDFNATKRHEQD